MSFNEELAKIDDPAIRKVCEYLLSRNDIKENLEKENKSIKDMWSYIVQEAHKLASGKCACIADEDVYSWAVHYYDEDDIKISKNIPVQAKVNNAAVNSDNKVDNDVAVKSEELKAKKSKKKTSSVSDDQLSLFDFQVM